MSKKSIDGSNIGQGRAHSIDGVTAQGRDLNANYVYFQDELPDCSIRSSRSNGNLTIYRTWRPEPNGAAMFSSTPNAPAYDACRLYFRYYWYDDPNPYYGSIPIESSCINGIKLYKWLK
jgi:hypothetical protein